MDALSLYSNKVFPYNFHGSLIGDLPSANCVAGTQPLCEQLITEEAAEEEAMVEALITEDIDKGVERFFLPQFSGITSTKSFDTLRKLVKDCSLSDHCQMNLEALNMKTFLCFQNIWALNVPMMERQGMLMTIFPNALKSDIHKLWMRIEYVISSLCYNYNSRVHARASMCLKGRLPFMEKGGEDIWAPMSRLEDEMLSQVLYYKNNVNLPKGVYIGDVSPAVTYLGPDYYRSQEVPDEWVLV